MEMKEELTELKALVCLLLQKIEVLEKENAALKAENAQLRERLKMNSSNSDKPPASDGLSKKPTVAIAKETGKKSGGQKGHTGHSLQMVETPDVILVHHAPYCPYCRQVFSSCQVEAYVSEKRQVFDLPEPKLLITQHQLGVISCCGQKHVGTFPPGVVAPVSYGVRIHAMSSLLNTDFRLPVKKISQLFADLYGCSYNERTFIHAHEKLYQALWPVEQNIKEQILESQVVHFDETGMRVDGQLHWFHTACTATLCYLFVHKQRGRQALIADESLLKEFTHWAIHDCWKPYFTFKDCKHGLCNAHLLRELVCLQAYGTDHPVGIQGSQWAFLMHKFLFDLYKESQKGTKLVTDKDRWMQTYQQICQQANEQEPLPIQKARGKPKNSKGRNLLNRLVEHQEGVLAFAFVEAVPFTNNRAEQAIRCVKIKQKVAMSFRTCNGAKIYARVQGFVTSCRKQRLNVFQQLIMVLNGETPLFRTT